MTRQTISKRLGNSVSMLGNLHKSNNNRVFTEAKQDAPRDETGRGETKRKTICVDYFDSLTLAFCRCVFRTLDIVVRRVIIIKLSGQSTNRVQVQTVWCI